jgi:hypothetical protein
LQPFFASPDWRTWRASTPAEGDPAVIEDQGCVVLFYSYCAEQGIAAADVSSFIR